MYLTLFIFLTRVLNLVTEKTKYVESSDATRATFVNIRSLKLRWRVSIDKSSEVIITQRSLKVLGKDSWVKYLKLYEL